MKFLYLPLTDKETGSEKTAPAGLFALQITVPESSNFKSLSLNVVPPEYKLSLTRFPFFNLKNKNLNVLGHGK